MEENNAVLDKKRIEPRPWLRFLARKIDMVIYMILAMIPIVIFFVVLGLLGVSETLVDSLFFSLLMGSVFLLLMVSIEAVVLFWWETTPGKKLLNIKVIKQDGESLDFGDAFERTARLWLAGLGLGLPVISILTQIYSYTNLVEEKSTYWDRKCSTDVVQGEATMPRVTIATIVALSFFALEIYVNIVLT